MYTKVSKIAKKRNPPLPKTAPLVVKLINRDKDLSKFPAITWGIEHEEKGLKSFMPKKPVNTKR